MSTETSTKFTSGFQRAKRNEEKRRSKRRKGQSRILTKERN
jgi:hypothetical protein